MNRLARWGVLAALMGCAGAAERAAYEEPLAGDAGSYPSVEHDASGSVNDGAEDEDQEGAPELDAGTEQDSGPGAHKEKDSGTPDSGPLDAGNDSGSVDAGPCILHVTAPDLSYYAGFASYPNGAATLSIPYYCPDYGHASICRNHIVAAGAVGDTLYPAPGKCRIAVPAGCLPCTGGATEW